MCKIKVVCCKIHYDHLTFEDFTVGRIYDAIDWDAFAHRQQYSLVDNFGFRKFVSKDYFRLLSELRDERIDEIFND